jgi:hypothetical protein
MDSLHGFKCKRSRNTRHTVTFAVPLQIYFLNTLYKLRDACCARTVSTADILTRYSDMFVRDAKVSGFDSALALFSRHCNSPRGQGVTAETQSAEGQVLNVKPLLGTHLSYLQRKAELLWFCMGVKLGL